MTFGSFLMSVSDSTVKKCWTAVMDGVSHIISRCKNNVTLAKTLQTARETGNTYIAELKTPKKDVTAGTWCETK